jgi:dephospho-CoA kinase
MRPLVVGLTGGVASGKTAVSSLLGDLGASIVDTDVIAREVVCPGSPGLVAVVNAFGESVRTADGQLDRRQLRQLIFEDALARRKLESILHPLIRAEARSQVRSATAPYVVLVVPLLVESGQYEWVDRVLVVDAAPGLQHQLLTRRDGIDADLASNMIRAQASRLQRLERADDVVRNSAGLEELGEQVRMFDRRYRTLAKNRQG